MSSASGRTTSKLFRLRSLLMRGGTRPRLFHVVPMAGRPEPAPSLSADATQHADQSRVPMPVVLSGLHELLGTDERGSGVPESGAIRSELNQRRPSVVAVVLMLEEVDDCFTKCDVVGRAALRGGTAVFDTISGTGMLGVSPRHLAPGTDNIRLDDRPFEPSIAVRGISQRLRETQDTTTTGRGSR